MHVDGKAALLCCVCLGVGECVNLDLPTKTGHGKGQSRGWRLSSVFRAGIDIDDRGWRRLMDGRRGETRASEERRTESPRWHKSVPVHAVRPLASSLNQRPPQRPPRRPRAHMRHAWRAGSWGDARRRRVGRRRLGKQTRAIHVPSTDTMHSCPAEVCETSPMGYCIRTRTIESGP